MFFRRHPPSSLQDGTLFFVATEGARVCCSLARRCRRRSWLSPPRFPPCASPPVFPTSVARPSRADPTRTPLYSSPCHPLLWGTMRLAPVLAVATLVLAAAGAPAAALTKSESLPFTVHPGSPGSVEVALDTPPIPSSTCTFAYATVGATPEAWEAVVTGDGDTNSVTCTIHRAGGGETYLMFTSWEVALGGEAALLDATVRDGGGGRCPPRASTPLGRAACGLSRAGGGGASRKLWSSPCCCCDPVRGVGGGVKGGGES